jgi:hypothetical protein
LTQERHGTASRSTEYHTMIKKSAEKGIHNQTKLILKPFMTKR